MRSCHTLKLIFLGLVDKAMKVCKSSLWVMIQGVNADLGDLSMVHILKSLRTCKLLVAEIHKTSPEKEGWQLR